MHLLWLSTKMPDLFIFYPQILPTKLDLWRLYYSSYELQFRQTMLLLNKGGSKHLMARNLLLIYFCSHKLVYPPCTTKDPSNVDKFWKRIWDKQYKNKRINNSPIICIQRLLNGKKTEKLRKQILQWICVLAVYSVNTISL